MVQPVQPDEELKRLIAERDLIRIDIKTQEEMNAVSIEFNERKLIFPLIAHLYTQEAILTCKINDRICYLAGLGLFHSTFGFVGIFQGEASS